MALHCKALYGTVPYGTARFQCESGDASAILRRNRSGVKEPTICNALCMDKRIHNTDPYRELRPCLYMYTCDCA